MKTTQKSDEAFITNTFIVFEPTQVPKISASHPDNGVEIGARGKVAASFDPHGAIRSWSIPSVAPSALQRREDMLVSMLCKVRNYQRPVIKGFWVKNGYQKIRTGSEDP